MSVLIFHVFFASIGLFYRYEAYIVFLGWIIISISSKELLNFPQVQRKKSGLIYYGAITLLILLNAYPLGYRAIRAILVTPQATKNIYEQQYQMGIFIKEFYQGETIAVNDIGAIAYLADVQIIDLWGLSSPKSAQLRLQHTCDANQLQELVNEENGTIAIVFEHWFNIPPTWEKMGQWTIRNNIVCSSDTVTFYAISKSSDNDLSKNLRNFSGKLPKGILQRGLYTKESQ